MLNQAISERFAQLTGRWGIDNTITTVPATNPDFFDLESIDRTMQDLSQQERGWRSFYAEKVSFQ